MIDFSKIKEQFLYNPQEPILFNTGFFMFLFTAFIGVYALLHKTHRAKITFVTLFSLYFYYKSSGIYFLILIASTVVDYTLANFIYQSKTSYTKKVWLVISLIVNLGLLGYFKYTNFVLDIFYNIANKEFEPLDIFLPVGVSFFTFQSLSYTLDIYRGTLKPVKNIFDYAFFVSFFPQLVAGPIVRAHDFIPQLYKPTFVSKEMFGRGLFLIACGLFKKAVISDYISVNFIDRIFDNPTLYSGFENLMGVYAYALQIYCDFSGYSDMAIGIALLLGFEFCLNFDSPYQSKSITEFWRKWHMSLSSWLRDYLYISLGGNRLGKWRTYFNLFVTMLLGGLWHGASFNFIFWGAMHGSGLAVHKYYLEIKGKLSKSFTSFFDHKWIATLVTFHFVCFCWILFRAPNFVIAKQLLHQIFTAFNAAIVFTFITSYYKIVLLMLLGYALHFVPKQYETLILNWFTQTPLTVKVACMLVVIIIFIQVKSAEIQPFIYFQF
ncbi:MAG: MBOAT family O-acyltransferase [Bacteroidota bacterium]